MRTARNAGIAACIMIIISAFLPWIYVAPIQQTFTGMNTGNSNFGKPALMEIMLTVWILAFVWIDRIWSKRANVLLAAFLLAWCIRNYFLLSRCEMGYCPEKLPGLYLSTACGLIIFIAALLPTAPKHRKTKSDDI